MLFECQSSHFPPLRDLFDTLNHLVSVTNEGIKRNFWLSMTLGSTYSWESVPILVGICCEVTIQEGRHL